MWGSTHAMHKLAMQPAHHEHQVSSLAAARPPGRAVVYLRVSSVGQIRRDYAPEGISIPAQPEACRCKVQQLGMTIVDEYVEPGRSALEMSKRTAFQRMLARIRDTGDVDHVIVYKLSRLARNRVDDALVMADLRQRGVTLIAATESVDDSPVGQLMHGILATFNEYQSRESGADIAYKMGQKARNGGTISRARLGYLNHTDRTDGRDIRTIVVDPERAPLVRLGFEQFAAGNLTLDQLSERLYQRGLRTRPHCPVPSTAGVDQQAGPDAARPLLPRLPHLPRQRTPGRHEPIVDQHLFDRVQAVFDARTTSGERRRVHHHYLKGTLYCGHCHQAGTTVAEHAVERYYATIRQQQVVDALARLATGDTADHHPDHPVAPGPDLPSPRRRPAPATQPCPLSPVYLAGGRITNHDPWSATP